MIRGHSATSNATHLPDGNYDRKVALIKAASHGVSPSVGIVIPVFNEATRLGSCLVRLLRQTVFHEIIVVDGGSEDGTHGVVGKLFQRHGDAAKSSIRLIEARRGRAMQMNTGALHAGSDILLFLHVDTRLPQTAAENVRAAVLSGRVWGHFDVHIGDDHVLFRIIERLMNLRAALSGIATGDQAIFVRRDVFTMLGGYAPIALMEDIELCRRLKRVGRPARLRDVVTTSARRWRRNGIVRTIVLMWSLRLLYWLGVPPGRLGRFYKNTR